jgi:2-(1,2-epoxy-1,2-dihydrophenyl)acetyl-CoA isomerase
MASDSRPYVEVERHGAVALLRLSRPERLNALGIAMTDDALDALTALEQDRTVRALVLAGAGRAFSAGGDIADVAAKVADGDAWDRLSLLREVQRLTVRLRDSRLPVITAVSGAVYGAGWSVVLAGDLVVAARDARFQQAFVHRNLVPDLGSAWLLPRTVGMLRAKELMLLGEALSAEDAYELGLVNRLAEDRDAAEAEADALAARLADAAPATVAMAKSLINRSQSISLEDSLRIEEHAQAIALGTPASHDAMKAFLRRNTATSDA